MNKTCYGCIHLKETSDSAGGGIYQCAKVPGLVLGEWGHWTSSVYDEPRRLSDSCFESAMNGWGKTGTREKAPYCSECGGGEFKYSNGHEYSKDGVRGYRCLNCGAIKPELRQGD